MKKIFSVIFAAAIVATMFVVGAVSTSAADKITVYFEIPSTEITDKLEYEEWGENVCVHIWKPSDENWADATTWPGFAAEVTDGVAKAEIPADTEGLIFNNAAEGGSASVQTADITEIVDGDIYRLTGETAENPVDSEKTVAVVAHEHYAAADATESTETTESTESTESTETTTSTETAESTATGTDNAASDSAPVQTGDSSAAWVLIAVVAASLGTAVVMTKKASAKD